MRVFVTGGSGFVGGAIIRSLGQGNEIMAMSRSAAGDAKIVDRGGRPVRCDLDNITAEHIGGCEFVIHCAAHLAPWGPLEDYNRINIEGTRNLVKAAQEAGTVRRLVHIGTEASLFFGQPMVNVDESYPLAFNSPFPYSRTKAHAEKIVLDANDATASFETISIRPRLVWGPEDESVLPAVRQMVETGRFQWIDHGKAETSSTHIDNLAHAVSLAMTKGKPGNAYFVLDDGTMTMHDFFTRYLATIGLDPGNESLPGNFVRLLANVTEPLWRLFGAKSPPPVTRLAAHIMSRDCILIDQKARCELGYQPVISVDEGFRALQKPD